MTYDIIVTEAELEDFEYAPPIATVIDVKDITNEECNFIGYTDDGMAIYSI